MKKALVVLLVSLLVASCGQKAEKRIIGKWALESEPGEMYVEFFADNTFLIPDYGFGDTSGKWIILDDSRLKTEDPDNGVQVFENLQISGGRMTFLDRNSSEAFVRVE